MYLGRGGGEYGSEKQAVAAVGRVHDWARKLGACALMGIRCQLCGIPWGSFIQYSFQLKQESYRRPMPLMADNLPPPATYEIRKKKALQYLRGRY